MPETVDDIVLDENNIKFNQALDLVKHNAPLVYLTGKAGTGKTTFLKYLRNTTSKNTVVLAYTGVAAINAGGQTINSFFNIPFGPFEPNDRRLRTKADPNEIDRSIIYNHFQYSQEKIDIIKGLELLIIDEVSMVRCDLLDVIDKLLKVFRKRRHESFGGVQVLLIGDTFQLAPISNNDERIILNQFYDSEFFFGAKIIEQSKLVYIELEKIYRQKEEVFIELLNKIRVNQISQSDLDFLNKKYNPTFSSSNENYITLATHNDIVRDTNLTKLSSLPSPLQIFEAIITNNFPDKIMPTDRQLNLKEGAQVMFIKNDRNKRYYNGKIAKIKKIAGDEITVTYRDDEDDFEIKEILVEKQTWNNVKYTWNNNEKRIEEEIIGTFTQFPLKLAWAITVHKSQGLTFEKVIADLGAAFTSGQVYVALSRCTTLSGLVLKTRIDSHAIITDSKVLEFAQKVTPNTLIIEQVNAGKADYYYQKSRNAVKLFDFVAAIDYVSKAIKFRNDIETDVFKRYLSVYSQRVKSFKELSTYLIDCLAENKENNILLQSENSVLQIANLKYEKKVGDSISELEKLNGQIKMLEKQLSNSNLIYDSQKKENTTLKKERNAFERSLRKAEGDYILAKKHQTYYADLVEEKSTKINDLEKQLEIQNNQILRLKNLKWYHKLFGIK